MFTQDWFDPWPWRAGKWRMNWNLTYVQSSAQKSKCIHQWIFIKPTHLNNRNLRGDTLWPSSLLPLLKGHVALNSQTWGRWYYLVYITNGIKLCFLFCVIFVRFAPTVECTYGSITVIAGEYFILWLYHNLHIHSTEDDIWVVSISGPLTTVCQEYSCRCQMSF